MKAPKQSKPYHVNYLEGFWYAYARDILKVLSKNVFTKIPSLRGRFSLPRKVRIEWIIIAFLLAIVLSGARARVIPEPFKPPPQPKLIEKLPQTHLEAVETVNEVEVTPTPPITPVAVTGSCSAWLSSAGIPVSYGVMELINSESGCNPYALNPSSGACHIGQELPCGKSGCSSSDPVCQLAWMNSYVLGRYGSWAGAWGFHLANNWY